MEVVNEMATPHYVQRKGLDGAEHLVEASERPPPDEKEKVVEDKPKKASKTNYVGIAALFSAVLGSSGIGGLVQISAAKQRAEIAELKAEIKGWREEARKKEIEQDIRIGVIEANEKKAEDRHREAIADRAPG